MVEAYGDDTQAHPVGTGPYMLKQWLRAAKIVIEANPDYRGFTWDFAVADPAWDDALVKAMRGKQMPQIGRVEISIIEEEQSRWLAFNQKELDILDLPATFRPEVFDADNRMKAEWTEQGVSLFKAIDPDITYTFFNFRDPLVGGFSKEKIALRRAIIMGYNLRGGDSRRPQAARRSPRKCRYRPASSATTRTIAASTPTTPTLANKLLDYFKYTRGKDGYRTLPDGKPLVIRQANGTTAIEREFNELWKKSMDAIGIRMEFQIGKFADHLKAAKACQLDDVGRGLDGRLSRRRQLHAAALRPEHRAEQQRLLRIEGLRRVLREVDDAAELAGAQLPVPRDDAADGSRRRVEPCRSRASATS